MRSPAPISVAPHPENEAKGATGSTKPGTATGGVTGNPRR